MKMFNVDHLPKVQLELKFMEDLRPPYVLQDADGTEIGIVVERSRLEKYSKVERFSAPSAVITGLLLTNGVYSKGQYPKVEYRPEVSRVPAPEPVGLQPTNLSETLVQGAVDNMVPDYALKPEIKRRGRKCL